MAIVLNLDSFGLVTNSPFQLVLLILSFTLASVAWLNVFVAKCKPGAKRLAASAPVILWLLCIPLLWNHKGHIVVRVSFLFASAWLGTFKVLAMCLNRGPLAKPRGFLQTLAILMLPVYTADTAGGGNKIQGRLHDEAGSPGILMLQGIAKTVLLVAVVFVAVNLQIATILHNYILAFGMVGFLGIIMDLPASLVCGALGMKIIPTFDQPWLSTSLADFWGRRWNITTSSVLRTVIHDTIMEGRLVKPKTGPAMLHAAEPAAADHHHPHHHRDHHQQQVHKEARHKREVRRAVGLTLTFLVSGVAHEIILCQLQDEARGPWRWKWLTFFTIQAPLVLAELWLKRWWLQRKRLPPLPAVLACGLTTLLLISLSTPLFFTPAEHETDTAQRMIDALLSGFKFLASALRGLMPSSAALPEMQVSEL
ncbi:hypothetical protein DUNSADRAFT_11486 [Dunaliella salina]|uniref:Wax synthase domain-containing protein n=1 Tax=Dunaliella salina TaxID=3046 RepID=A0ABQ7GDA1_DUNSA|nr:hypothetical protein DUNSADRAFT_11486 [Dunaliella salina]|eukprot:KAF5832586.1 hypothetical protein DUNSADRAFT_11486 [Dunaliella salina]